MTDTDVAKILRVLEEQNKDRDLKHDEFAKSIATIEEKLDPVYAIYSQFTGFGKVVRFLFVAIVIPVSVIIGIVVAFKKLHE